MKYFEKTENGKILAWGAVITDREIPYETTQQRYDEIKAVADSVSLNDGEYIVFNTDLSYEIFVAEEEATEEDYLNALNQLGVNTNEEE